MSGYISDNTKATLLLMAPLMSGPGGSKSIELLTPGEYKRLVKLLTDNQCSMVDFLEVGAECLAEDCQPVVDSDRLLRLLGRSFLLSQAIERWQSRAIWVVSSADDEYPQRLKDRLHENAPPILYGCGKAANLEMGGLAVVGSRNVNDELVEYTEKIGALCAEAGETLISGCARGIDQASMRGALSNGGKVVGVMADSLERTVMSRENRDFIMDGQLTLVSPFDPLAGFNVGNAMQRNKYIYTLADAGLIVNADHNKGGTWSGAVEQLDKYKFGPVYVRTKGEESVALTALIKKGALPWPEPESVGDFLDALHVELAPIKQEPQPQQGELFFGEAVNEVTAVLKEASADYSPKPKPKRKSKR